MATNLFKGFLRLMHQSRILKPYSSTPLISSTPLQYSLALQYLTNTLGLSPEKALISSQKHGLDDKNWPKYQSIFDFLKSYGFTDTDNRKLVTNFHCRIFQFQLDKTLKPKFEYLADRGFVGLLLPSLVLSHPNVLNGSLKLYLKPLIDFLKQHLDTNEKIIAAFRRSSLKMSASIMQKNVEFLLNENVPRENIRKLVLRRPYVLSSNSDRVASAVNTIKKLGISPLTGMLPLTLNAFICVNDFTLKRQLQLFRSYGWSAKDFFSVIMKFPNFITCSEKKIKGAVDFYVNTMKMEPEFIIHTPTLFGYSIDKRVVPRYNLLRFLESKELIKPIKNYVNVVQLSEKRFVMRYVTKFENEVPQDLIKFYKTNK